MDGLAESLPHVTTHQFIFVVLLVITLYMVFNYYDPMNKLSTSLLIASVGAMFVFGWKIYTDYQSGKEPENLVGPPHYPTGELPAADTRPILADGSLNMNLQDTEHSNYGNMSKNFDVDYIGQNSHSRMNFPTQESDNRIDNSDVFDDLFNNGSSTHVPLEADSRGFHNVKDRTWYMNHFQDPQNITAYAEHSTPRNDRAINADDMLTRRQLHIGDINKKAIDGAVRGTRQQFEHLYTHELAENYARDWWDGEGDDGIMGGVEVEWETF